MDVLLCFEKQGSVLKHWLKSFLQEILFFVDRLWKISVFILVAYIWIFFQGIVSQWVSLKYTEKTKKYLGINSLK